MEFKSTPPPPNMCYAAPMKENDAAWLAGYIDGDGCISLIRQSGRNGARKPIVAISSCDRELLEKARSIIGAGSLSVKGRSRNPAHRDCYHYQLHGSRQVLGLMRSILPFMGCADKIARAKMIVEEWEGCTPRNGCYTSEMLALKDSFERRFLAIGHRRGIRLRTSVPPAPSENLRVMAQKMARGPRNSCVRPDVS